MAQNEPQRKETPPNSPSLLFEYQCRSGKFIRLANRIESKKIDSAARIESNRNFFAGIGMLYHKVTSNIVITHKPNLLWFCYNGRGISWRWAATVCRWHLGHVCWGIAVWVFTQGTWCDRINQTSHSSLLLAHIGTTKMSTPVGWIERASSPAKFSGDTRHLSPRHASLPDEDQSTEAMSEVRPPSLPTIRPVRGRSRYRSTS